MIESRLRRSEESWPGRGSGIVGGYGPDCAGLDQRALHTAVRWTVCRRRFRSDDDDKSLGIGYRNLARQRLVSFLDTFT